MKILNEKPPVWDAANQLFKLDELNLYTVFTYGDTLYNPSGIAIPADLMVHEQIHMRQQQGNETVAKLWWERYLTDPDWRIQQEIEAYHAQYQYLETTTKDRNKRASYLWRLAAMLAGQMYGRTISHREAMQRIKRG